MLLFAVAAQREMAWPAFSSAIDSIFVPDPRIATDVAHLRSAVAALGDALGHWEIVPDGATARVCIAPPVLAVLPHTGRPSAVLCGSRSADTHPALADVCRALDVDLRVTRQDHLTPYAPSVFELTADSYETLAEAGSRLHVAILPSPVAWNIAEALGSLDGYLASLEWLRSPDLNWPRRDFDHEHLRLASVPIGAVRDGLTLSAYRHPDGWMRQDRLWRSGESAIADRDWARYAVLASQNVRVITYDMREGTVAVARQVPLPRLAARSFALSSGYTPLAKPGTGLGVWVYSRVPASIFQTVASKLGQDGAGDGEAHTP